MSRVSFEHEAIGVEAQNPVENASPVCILRSKAQPAFVTGLGFITKLLLVPIRFDSLGSHVAFYSG